MAGVGGPELVVLVGLPASGKSTFAQRFAATHEIVSMDALPGRGDRRGRRDATIQAALRAGRSVLVDAVNGTVTTRSRLLALARVARVPAVAYYLDVSRAICLARNRQRVGRARVPDVAIHASAARLVPPRREEGFARVVRVEEATSPLT